ncbi:MAG: hypothetical protein MJH11_14755 [Lentisphaeria bacterium]|nr:hypothetical protein [Lentisphaeria bacterium]
MNQLFRWLGLDSFTEIDQILGYEFITESWLPIALVWLIFVVGLVLAAINFMPALKMQRRVRVLSFLLRLGIVGILLLVLLRVHLKLDFQQAYPQSWLALVDDSGSMGTADADGPRFQAAVKDLQTMKKRLGDDVDLDVAALSAKPLGEAVSKDSPTLIHRAILRELSARPGLRRLLLFSDGRDVERQDLSLAGEALKARGIALDIVLYGTETPAQDSQISAKPERSVIRHGEPLFIRGSLTDASDKGSCELTLEENGKEVLKTTVSRGSYGLFELIHHPEKPGLHRYRLSMAADDGFKDNNVSSFFADVREEKINVLMIEGKPRFGFKLMKVAIETDPLVNLACVSLDMPGGGLFVQGKPLHSNPAGGLITSDSELYKYDIVILRDVPRTSFRTGEDESEAAMDLLVSFVKKRGGGLVTFGGQSVYRAGGYADSSLATILPFDLSKHFSKAPHFPGRFTVDVVDGKYQHPLLQLLPSASDNRDRWNALPELDGCNNVGLVRPLAQQLLSRRVQIRNAKGEQEWQEVPIMAYLDLGKGKVLSASADTFRYWQLQPHLDPPPLETLMANIVRYMAPEPGSRAGGVNLVVANPTPEMGQMVVLSSLLRDKDYSPLRLANLKVRVTKPDGQVLSIYPCDLPERPGYYEYRFVADQPGDWSAVASLGKDIRKTKFVVRGQDDEYAELAVNRESMAGLAAAADGVVVDDFAAWLKHVDVSSVREPAVRDLEIWNSPAVLVLFILLVCLDCFIRKRHGMA